MTNTIPTQSQMLLPLLKAIKDHGGEARASEVYGDVAEQLGVTADVRNHTITVNGRVINPFERRTRWVRQTCVLKGLISKEKNRVWRLTETAHAKLGNIARGFVVTFAISEHGALLWGNAEDVVGVLEPRSINLLCSSPPYPLNSPKEYGNLKPDRWVPWMLELCASWKDLLTEDGSMMLNIGPVFHSSEARQHLHTERLLIGLEDQLGIHLLQRLDWYSPTKLPSPLSHVCRSRVRVTPALEPILWLSPNPNAFGNNRAVLRPYSKEGLREIQKPRLKARPSGYKFGSNSFTDQGGSIPPSLLTAAPSGREEVRYRKAVRAAGLEPHPAIMPAAIVRFGVELATIAGDTVWDPFCGSGTVPAEAMKLGRKGIGSDRSLAYLEGAILRCQNEGVALKQTYIH